MGCATLDATGRRAINPRMAETTKSEDERVGGDDDAQTRTFLIRRRSRLHPFTQEHGDEAAARLAGRFAEAVRAPEAAHGHLVELRGDEALVAFVARRGRSRGARVPTSARRRDDLSTPLSTLPLAGEFGSDAGEAVVAVEDGFRGGALNLAARLCSFAPPAEVLTSTAVTHLARKGPPGSPTSTGHRRLKGLADPVQVVRLRAEADDRRTTSRSGARWVRRRPGCSPSPVRRWRTRTRACVRSRKLTRPTSSDGRSWSGSWSSDSPSRRFLAVVGPSGSGKSSVVRAGLIPAVRRGAIAGCERWRIVEMFPGPRPLERAGGGALRSAPDAPASVMEQLSGTSTASTGPCSGSCRRTAPNW